MILRYVRIRNIRFCSSALMEEHYGVLWVIAGKISEKRTLTTLGVIVHYKYRVTLVE